MKDKPTVDIEYNLERDCWDVRVIWTASDKKVRMTSIHCMSDEQIKARDDMIDRLERDI